MIKIDGSRGEGGGQILRTSLALSALSQEPVKIINIRMNRARSGLSNQHLTAVLSAAKLCAAEIEGCRKTSRELVFIPSGIQGGSHSFDVGSAGSVTLVLQALLPMLLGSESTVELRGGTDVRWSPSFDYFRHVFLPFLERMGAKLELTLHRRGHFPEGGGRVVLRTSPGALTPHPVLERGVFKGIKGKIHVSKLPLSIAHRIKKSAERTLEEKLAGTFPLDEDWLDIQISPQKGNTGCGLTLWGQFENTVMGFGLCGEKGLSSETLGAKVASTLAGELLSGATVDEWCADQLIPYFLAHGLMGEKGSPKRQQALTRARAPFLVRTISSHLDTNIKVLENFGFGVETAEMIPGNRE